MQAKKDGKEEIYMCRPEKFGDKFLKWLPALIAMAACIWAVAAVKTAGEIAIVKTDVVIDGILKEQARMRLVMDKHTEEINELKTLLTTVHNGQVRIEASITKQWDKTAENAEKLAEIIGKLNLWEPEGK